MPSAASASSRMPTRPSFDPPKPDLAAGLLQSFEFERELFSQATFKKAIKETFVKAGQVAKPDGNFIEYKSHERHSISSFLLKEGKTESASLAALAGNADVITYEEDEEPVTDEEELDEA